jgi:hypothetical protein
MKTTKQYQRQIQIEISKGNKALKKSNRNILFCDLGIVLIIGSGILTFLSIL